MVVSLVLLVICFFSLLSGSTVYGAASTWPAPIPLIHKSPYLNAWVDASSGVSNSMAQRWPHFFNQMSIGWFIGIRVDNTSYTIQGNGNEVNYAAEGTTVSTYILPTQTRFTIAAGSILVNVTYLTPIELHDWTLHSLPFAYAAFDIVSSDGNPHAVQVYTDTTAQFVSADDSNTITWNTSFTAKSTYHMAQQKTLQTLTENNDMSEDGSQILAYTATPGASMTWQTCSAGISRSDFSLYGKLKNTSDTNTRAIGDEWPVLAYALDLGNITETSNTLVFGIGLIRDPVVTYRTAGMTKSLSHLWYSRWGNIGSADLKIDDFLGSYSSASSRADAFDDHIQLSASALASQLHMSTSVSTKLVDLHILNLRQCVGSLEFTTSESRSGEPVAMDDVRVFMKDVGYSRRTNPVEILYASFPAFLFLNTTLAGKLLEPLLEFQASSFYTNAYAAPDLGSSWPIIQGNTTDQSLLAIDSCGAMLVMALAHAQKSGDGTLLFKYYYLLRRWADYLVPSTTQSSSYMSSDGLYSSNANLALKGIMGLYAMGQIDKILEARRADTSNITYYSDIANAYTQQWLDQAMSSDHIMATYESNSTWAMIYNLFAPRLLNATIIPEEIYETQASWYTNRSKSAATFGLPFDTAQSLAKAHWTLLSVSSVYNATSSEGRDDLISMVHSRSFWQSGVSANPATYLPTDGSLPEGSASPAMGAVYSMLALNLPEFPITLPRGALVDSQLPINFLFIVVATCGFLGGSILIAVVVYVLQKCRRPNFVHGPPEELRSGPSTITPFLVTNDIQVTETFYNEKFSRVAGGRSRAVNSSRGGEVSLGEDSNLRREVQELRRVVERLSMQEVQPRPQVVYQRCSLHEPPPMYLNRD